MNWGRATKATLRRRLLVSGLCLVVALSATGCWNPFAPPEGEDPPVNVSYKLRTSRENVLHNLRQAYVYKNLDEYLDCMSEDFMFYLNPDDPYEDPENPLDDSWDKQTEEDIHEAMFADVERISLTMTHISDQVIDPPDPGDPPTWEYVEEIDLRVAIPPDLTLLADADQKFLFQIDPLEVGPAGETLYEIYEWHDLPALRRDDAPDGERVTVSALKAMYR